jgi:hypothetical protein
VAGVGVGAPRHQSRQRRHHDRGDRVFGQGSGLTRFGRPR